MNKIGIFSLLIVASIVLLSGCVQPSQLCGNGVCDAGETQATCSIDCGEGEFTVKVHVIDSITEKSIEGAQVNVYENVDPFINVGGGLTDSDGVFKAYNVPKGEYYAKVSAFDYEVHFGYDDPFFVMGDTLVTVKLVPK